MMAPSAPKTILQACHFQDATFSIKKELRNHIEKTHPECKQCENRFENSDALHAHQKSTGHCYCQECDQVFGSFRRHLMHFREVAHDSQYQCCDCKQDFVDQRSLTTHCCVCDRVFRTKTGLDAHISASKLHKTRAQLFRFHEGPDYRNRCPVCKQGFATQELLSKHEKSNHKPHRVLPCPTNSKCGKKFATPSALFNHLESGHCKSRMNQQKLNELVVLHDHNNYITSKDAKSLLNHQYLTRESTPTEITSSQIGMAFQKHLDKLDLESNGMDENGVEMLQKPNSSTPTEDYVLVESVPGAPQTGDNASEWSMVSSPHTRPVDSSMSMNLDAFSSKVQSRPGKSCCYICFKVFHSPGALEMHLNSPVHAPTIFHCPLAFTPSIDVSGTHNARKKEKWFNTLSGLTRHMEAGACRGGIATFKNVISFVEEQLSELGLHGVELLMGQKI